MFQRQMQLMHSMMIKFRSRREPLKKQNKKWKILWVKMQTKRHCQHFLLCHELLLDTAPKPKAVSKFINVYPSIAVVNWNSSKLSEKKRRKTFRQQWNLSVQNAFGSEALPPGEAKRRSSSASVRPWECHEKKDLKKMWKRCEVF